MWRNHRFLVVDLVTVSVWTRLSSCLFDNFAFRLAKTTEVQEDVEDGAHTVAVTATTSIVADRGRIGRTSTTKLAMWFDQVGRGGARLKRPSLGIYVDFCRT